MINKVQKALLDDLLRIERKYWTTSDTDYLQARIHVSEKISEKTNDGSPNRWLAWCDFVSCVAGNAMRPGITDAQIYAALEALGFEIVDGEQEGEHEQV